MRHFTSYRAPGFLAGAILVCGIALSAQAAEPPSGLVLVETESRIEMDSAGNLVSVKTTPELPAEIRAEVERNLRKLQFVPPIKDGHPVAGVTFVQQDACAAPDNGAYRFAVKFRGNGPSLQKSYLLTYPSDPERSGVQSSWTVTYLIDTTGKASLVEALRTKGGGGRFDRDFRASIQRWLASMQFLPEQMDGQPVETRMQETVAFVLSRRPKSADAAAGRDACKLALTARDDENRAVALNSPFKSQVAN